MKIKIKIRKGWLVLFLTLLCVGLMARYALMDLRLDTDFLLKTLENTVGLTLENLEFEREIAGDLWRVRIPWAERHDEKVEIRSVEVERLMADGKEWYFRSIQGIYFEKEGAAELWSLIGTMDTGVRALNLESPLLTWSINENVFLFPRGVTLYDAEFILETGEASIDEEGIVMLKKGGSVRWTKSLE